MLSVSRRPGLPWSLRFRVAREHRDDRGPSVRMNLQGFDCELPGEPDRLRAPEWTWQAALSPCPSPRHRVALRAPGLWCSRERHSELSVVVPRAGGQCWVGRARVQPRTVAAASGSGGRAQRLAEPWGPPRVSPFRTEGTVAGAHVAAGCGSEACALQLSPLWTRRSPGGAEAAQARRPVRTTGLCV